MEQDVASKIKNRADDDPEDLCREYSETFVLDSRKAICFRPPAPMLFELLPLPGCS